MLAHASEPFFQSSEGSCEGTGVVVKKNQIRRKRIAHSLVPPQGSGTLMSWASHVDYPRGTGLIRTQGLNYNLNTLKVVFFTDSLCCPELLLFDPVSGSVYGQRL